MFSPESSEMSSGGDSRLSVDTLPDLCLGTIGGGISGGGMFLPESAEGPSRGVSPDPKRQKMEKKVEIYEEQEHHDFVTEDDEESEEDFVTEDDEESEEDFVTEDDEESEEEEMEIDEADDGMDKEISQVLDDGDSDYSSILELDNRIAYLKSIYDVPEKDDDDDVKKVNLDDEIKKPEMSEKEIDEILEKVERETGRVAGVRQNSDVIAHLLPSRGFEWIPPPGVNERSLEIYYMRLLPNVEYARKLIDPSNWNNLPDRDSQYVSLFSELNKCGLFEEKCYRLYLELPSTRRCEDMEKATEMAQDLKLGKLTGSDIYNCLMDVFMVRDNIAAHKLKEDYDLYLLDCRFDQSLRPRDFAPKDPHPVFYSTWAFRPQAQQRDFDRLMEKIGGSKMTKEECQIAIRDHHKKNYEEDCTIRIRYIKLKRTIAKKLRLIPEDD